jgi:hypothetical protein
MLGLLLLGLLLSPGQAPNTPEPKAAQAVSAKDPFETVPPNARADVKASVDLIVRLHKERQWDKVYDLLAEKTMSRSEYVREGSPWTLIEFFPTGVHQVWEKNTDWVVNGCALVDTSGRKERWESFILINLKDSNKRVRLLIALKKRGGPMPCLQPAPKPQ